MWHGLRGKGIRLPLQILVFAGAHPACLYQFPAKCSLLRFKQGISNTDYLLNYLLCSAELLDTVSKIFSQLFCIVDLGRWICLDFGNLLSKIQVDVEQG